MKNMWNKSKEQERIMNKKTYLEPTLRIVYLNAHCDDLMNGSAIKTGDEEVEDGDDFLGTRSFEFEWE